MFVPIVKPGMDRARQCSGLRIQPGEIRALVQIAMVAGQREILLRVLAFVLACGDVLDLKRQRLLPQPAVLTATRRALFDQLPQPGVHQAAFVCASTRRALA